MAQHHCQMSLEDFINVSGPEPLAAVQRSRMKDNFYSIVNHFRAAETSDNVYSRLLLVCYMYEYCRSELSQDTPLRTFYDFMGLDVFEASGLRTTQPSPSTSLDIPKSSWKAS
ncbi:hypothetical protein I7I51_02896 [Histoplasma capsulatum]|uniref:Uncharacterized protein n=1 Tax=Ajellomyces capsulatus TaxID=5037 RepID=A0A8A1MRL1_AJECA|nr:hypothetical protein I7I51_02896 [Histoplasma capsulatum]